ncbi:RlpA-like protein, double-psi beta-barrel domain [Sesbania bispinosa]|nr:RlpA-like protein, double-psi beta-barrel domain [Sesbania bispinosa]
MLLFAHLVSQIPFTAMISEACVPTSKDGNKGRKRVDPDLDAKGGRGKLSQMQAKELIDYLNVQNPSKGCLAVAEPLILLESESLDTFHQRQVRIAIGAMPKHSHFSLFIALVFTPFISSCYGDLGTAARWNPPYIPNACGFDVSQYPSNNIFAAAGEGIWNNGAACGRQYAVQCRSADAPGSCINGQTIQVMIVDRALTLTSQPSREGILMVISGTGFQAIANASATNINIDYKPS